MKRFRGPLKAVCIGVYDGPHATPRESTEGPVFLGITNVTADGRLDLTEIRHVSEEEFPRWTKRVTPQPNDIVFSYEATLHRYAMIPEGFRGCLGRRMGLVRVDPCKTNPRFLHYFFLSKKWRAVVEPTIVSGATVDRIPLTRFPDLAIDVPDIESQKRIASVLAAYDDFIESNRRRIRLLEDAARLLFREWFVHFRFPGHEHLRVIDGTPEGWDRAPLSTMCTDVRKQVAPSQVNEETPYIGLEHLPRRSITLAEWGKAEDVTSSKFEFQAGDILFGKIRPYFHKVGFTFVDGITSSDAIVIRAREAILFPYCLCLVSSDGFVALASKTVREGSKMPRADWKYLQEQCFPLPPESYLVEFNEIVSPILDQLRILAMQVRRLTEARGFLLPRLMSGEVEV